MKTPLLLAGLAVALCAGAARAEPVLDQNFVIKQPAYGLDSSVAGNWSEVAQTFTCGATGKLTSIQLPNVYRNDHTTYPNLILSLLNVDSSGVPLVSETGRITQVEIASSAVPANAYSTLNVDLTSRNVQVTAGQRLAFSLRATWGHNQEPQSTAWWFHGAVLPDYERGSYYDRSYPWYGVGWTEHPTYDLFFRTYVNAVPEPSSVLAMMTGLVGLGGAVWRRRKA